MRQCAEYTLTTASCQSRSRPTAPDGPVGVADLPDENAVAEQDDLMVWAPRARAEEVRRAGFSGNGTRLVDRWDRDLVAHPQDVRVGRRGFGGMSARELAAGEGGSCRPRERGQSD